MKLRLLLIADANAKLVEVDATCLCYLSEQDAIAEILNVGVARTLRRRPNVRK